MCYRKNGRKPKGSYATERCRTLRPLPCLGGICIGLTVTSLLFQLAIDKENLFFNTYPAPDKIKITPHLARFGI